MSDENLDLTKLDKNEICHIKCHQRKAYQKEIQKLEKQLKQTQDRLKDAEDALSKYADVNNWSYQQIIDDISEVNGSLEGGAEAREYFKKYGESDLEFKGACYACEVVAETNIKLQKRINELEAKIKHW